MVYYKKSGLPEKGELVVCTVKKVLPHASFCILDEYHEKEGMLHISEISSKWVKNIREFVTEGKQIVCKVVGTNKIKGHVDLSLRKVSDVERERKFNEWRLEKRIDKLLQITEEKLKKKKGSYEEIGDKILDKYGALFILHEEIREKEREAVDKLDIPKQWADAIYEVISDQLKSQNVTINANLSVHSNSGTGVKDLNKLFKELSKFCKDSKISCEVKYIGTPKYRLTITAKNYKIAEVDLKNIVEFLEKKSKKLEIEFSWERK